MVNGFTLFIKMIEKINIKTIYLATTCYKKMNISMNIATYSSAYDYEYY